MLFLLWLTSVVGFELFSTF